MDLLYLLNYNTPDSLIKCFIKSIYVYRIVCKYEKPDIRRDLYAVLKIYLSLDLFTFDLFISSLD